MLRLHKSGDRGTSRMRWLDSRHSFSFAGWHDPSRMGFRSLRVLNEDRVAPGTGFGPHPHRDMEILTVILDGALEHRDSSGNHSVLRAGDVQGMSAGLGVAHSEWNASDREELHFLQIWLLPAERGLEPGYQEARQVLVAGNPTKGGMRPVASATGGDGVLEIHADATVYAGGLGDRATAIHSVTPGRGVWVQAFEGDLRVNGVPLTAGDGLEVVDEERVEIAGDPAGRFLLFDLA